MKLWEKYFEATSEHSLLDQGYQKRGVTGGHLNAGQELRRIRKLQNVDNA